ncbi:MAG: hypothetical protein WD872_13195 [Pirellulaceae bacterium]
MSLATIPLAASNSRLLGPSTGGLTLSIRTGEHEGRVIPIRSAKCTIGSARGCTLRLRAPGVRPLHCWILRGAAGTIVRRRDPQTRLNGRVFSDAPLKPGDRLQIGGIEIEVQECPALPVEWDVERAAAVEDPTQRLWEESSREAAAAIDQLRDEMQSLERRATQQLAELNELVGRLSTERDTLQEQLGTTEIDAAGHSEQLLAERRELTLALAHSQQQLAELSGRLCSRESEIAAALEHESQRVAQVQRQLDDVLRERAALESQLQQQTNSLRSQCEVRQQERDRLQDECQRLDVHLAQLRELVGYTAAERDQLTVQLDDEQRRLLDQQHQVSREKADVQQRLEGAVRQLAEAEQRLAVIQLEGDHHLQSEMQHVSELQHRLDNAEFERNELDTQLQQQAATWQHEPVSLQERHDRLGEQTRQFEGQLTHLRDLVESLAGERDSLCQQLEATDLKLASEQQEFGRERGRWEERLSETSQQMTEREREMSHAADQLSEAGTRLAAIQEESEARRQNDSERAGQWQQQAEETRVQMNEAQDRWTAALADNESRLVAEAERAAHWQRQAEEAAGQRAALSQQIAGLEARLAELPAQDEAREQAQTQRAAEWEERAAELETTRASLAAEYNELTEAVRFERESWQHDRERLHQECRLLGHRLIQKQKELDDRLECARIAVSTEQATPVGQMTVTMDQIRAQAEACDALEQRQTEWTEEKETLEAQIRELQRQLEDQPRFTQQMTLTGEGLAELPLSAWTEPAVDDESQLAQSEQLDRERQAGADERDRLALEQQQFAAAQQESAAQREQFAATQVEFESRWKQWEETLRGKEQVLNRQAEELADRLDRVAVRADEVQRQRDEQGQLQASLEQQSAALAEREAALRVAEEPRASSGQDEEDARSTLVAQISPQVDETPGAAERFAPQFSTGSEPAGQSPKPVWNDPGAAAVADDDSIESYMAGLLKRVRGDAPAGASQSSQAPPVRSNVPAPAPKVESILPEPAQGEAATGSVSPPTQPVVEEEFTPRYPAPELKSGLAAMRELANSAARTAIVKHARRSGGRAALAQSLGAVMTLGCGALAAYWAWRTHSLPAGAGAGIGLAAALYWGGKAAWRGFGAMRLRAPQWAKPVTTAEIPVASAATVAPVIAKSVPAPADASPVESSPVESSPNEAIGDEALLEEAAPATNQDPVLEQPAN